MAKPKVLPKATKTNSSSAASAGGSITKPVIVAAASPPNASAPATPADFKPANGVTVRRLKKPTADQLASAHSVAGEIERSAKYVDDFGPKALGAAAFGAALRTAASWSEEAAHARSWASFAENCAGLSWDSVLGGADKFKGDFNAGVGHDASILRRYPELTGFVRARSVAARRAVDTKKAKKSAAKKAAKQTGG